jgi:hypothetical protein
MLLAAEGSSVEAIDFLQPRRTIERPDYRRLKLAVAAAAAGLFFAAAFGVTHWRAARLDAEIAAKQEEVDRIAAAVKAGGPLLKAAQSVTDWETHSADWLQLMSDMNGILPGTDRVYLRDYRFRSLTGDVVAQVQANGCAKSRRDVEALYQGLAKRNYDVRPHEISETSDDPDYPVQFELDVTIPADVKG